MAGRTIKDLDKDMGQLKANVENINGALSDIVLLLQAKEVEAEAEANTPTPLEVAHEAEFGHYKKVKSESKEYPKTCYLPEFEMGEVIFKWVEAVAHYHKRTIEQELQFMVKKLYYASKAETDAALSRVNND